MKYDLSNIERLMREKEGSVAKWISKNKFRKSFISDLKSGYRKLALKDALYLAKHLFGSEDLVHLVIKQFKKKFKD